MRSSWRRVLASRKTSGGATPELARLSAISTHQIQKGRAPINGSVNQRGTAEQWIKEGKNAIKWTRLSCCSFAANAVRLQLHALAYNLANFMRTLALPE